MGNYFRSGYYKLLGIEPWATKEEIKKAYKKKSIELHPDSHMGDSETMKQYYAQKFIKLKIAYDILSDPAEKSRYDKFYGINTQKPKEPPVENTYEREPYNQYEIDSHSSAYAAQDRSTEKSGQVSWNKWAVFAGAALIMIGIYFAVTISNTKGETGDKKTETGLKETHQYLFHDNYGNPKPGHDFGPRRDELQ